MMMYVAIHLGGKWKFSGLQCMTRITSLACMTRITCFACMTRMSHITPMDLDSDGLLLLYELYFSCIIWLLWTWDRCNTVMAGIIHMWLVLLVWLITHTIPMFCITCMTPRACIAKIVWLLLVVIVVWFVLLVWLLWIKLYDSYCL